MKRLCEMVKGHDGGYTVGKVFNDITGDDAASLKKTAVSLINRGELNHGYYLAVPANGRNKVWSL